MSFVSLIFFLQERERETETDFDYLLPKILNLPLTESALKLVLQICIACFVLWSLLLFIYIEINLLLMNL